MSRTQTETPRAALWDVDGTLINSSEYHWLSWRDALAAENFPVTREQFAATFGQRNDEILRAYFPTHTPEEIARVGDAKEVRYRELIRARGIGTLYHWNPIYGWKVAANGRVFFHGAT